MKSLKSLIWTAYLKYGNDDRKLKDYLIENGGNPNASSYHYYKSMAKTNVQGGIPYGIYKKEGEAYLKVNPPRPKAPFPFLFPYAGMKTTLLDDNLNRFFPSNCRFVSVFGGSATDLLAHTHKAEEIYNDKDEHISTLLTAIRHDLPLLKEYVLNAHYGKSTFCKALKALNSKHDTFRAFAFLAAQFQAFRPQVHASKMRPCAFRPSPTNERRWSEMPKRLDYFARRFQNVKIHRLDWRKMIEQYDSPNTFFFLDPPYHPEGQKPLYRHNLTAKDHQDLAATLASVKGKVMLLGNPHKDYGPLSPWNFTNLCHRGVQCGRIINTGVWMNYYHQRQANYKVA